MQKIQGYIDKITTKTGHGKNGPWTLYSILVNDNWYSCGFDAPKAAESQYVEFDAEPNGKYNPNVKNLQVVQAAAAAPAAVGGAPKALPVNKKDVSIHFQSCRKDAIQTVGLLLQSEAVKLPAKQADKFDVAMALIDELTARYYLRLEDVIEEGGVSVEDMVPSTDAA